MAPKARAEAGANCRYSSPGVHRQKHSTVSNCQNTSRLHCVHPWCQGPMGRAHTAELRKAPHGMGGGATRSSAGSACAFAQAGTSHLCQSLQAPQVVVAGVVAAGRSHGMGRLTTRIRVFPHLGCEWARYSHASGSGARSSYPLAAALPLLLLCAQRLARI